MGGGVVWMLEVAKVVGMLEVAKVMGVFKFNDEEGYEKIFKVNISKMTNISAIVDLVEKKSKEETQKEN
jgi:hypothetical protein